MMVYGLQPDKVNTDKLFNLFCLYGNVTKVYDTVWLQFRRASTCSRSLSHRGASTALLSSSVTVATFSEILCGKF